MRLSPVDEAKIKRYEELLAEEPNTLVFASLGSLYARKYEFEKAVAILDRGLQYFPNYFSARVLLAKCYLALNHFDAAIGELGQVLSADPNNVSALGLLGDEYRGRGQIEQARTYYDRILELDPNNEEYQYKLYLLQEGAKPVTQTAPPEAKAITPEIKPVEAEKEKPPVKFDGLATVTLARIYLDQGLFNKARDIISAVIERDPANREAQQLRERLDAALATGKLDAPAAAEISTGIDIISGLLEADEFVIGEVEAFLGDIEDIKQSLARIVTPSPDGSTVGASQFDIGGTLPWGASGDNEFNLAKAPAEIYMIEFDLPEVAVMAGELGITEVELSGVLLYEEDDFSIDGLIRGSEEPGKSAAGGRNTQGINTAVSAPTVNLTPEPGSIPETADEAVPQSKETKKLAPEDIIVYKPSGAVYGSEETGVTGNSGNATSATEVPSETGFLPESPLTEEGEPLMEIDDNPFDEESEDFLGWLNSIKLKEV